MRSVCYQKQGFRTLSKAARVQPLQEKKKRLSRVSLALLAA
jgi:hypothetical protein